MPHEPSPGCADLRFAAPLALDPAAEVALEDYARVLLRGRDAEAIGERDSGRVIGVHVCGAALPPGEGGRTDVEAFAREMAGRSESGGLGWS
jgi:hypothetical protein